MVNYMAMLKDVTKRAEMYNMEDILNLVNLKMEEFDNEITETQALQKIAEGFGIFDYCTDYRGRVSFVAKQTKRTTAEIMELMDKQIEDLSGLIDEDGAIVIVAKTLGVKLHYDDN